MTADRAAAVDVAVLGAGPAGCAAARTLAREGGRSVALIDRLPAGGSSGASPCPRAAGETLPPAARAGLAALGVWERFAAAGHLPSPGVISAWGGQEPAETDFLFHPHGCGWHLDRAAFGRLLQEAAQEAGARLLPGFRLRAAERRRHGGWELLLAPARDGGRNPAAPSGSLRLAARCLVIATGRSLPAELPLPAAVRERTTLDRLVALAARLPAARPPAAGRDPRLLLEAAPGEWWYVAPLPGDARSAVFLTDADLVRAAGGATALWHKALAEAPLTRHQVGDPAGIRVAAVAAQSCCRRAVAGPDFVLVGDAACAWDPVAGQGLRRALEEGRAAALAAAARLDSGSSAPLREYAGQVRASWSAYVRQWAEVYGAERRWESAPFWRRRHAALPPS